MKKSELRQLIRDEIQRLNEHHLKPVTRVLYIKNKTLTPATVVRHHKLSKDGNDWYWIADKKGNEELLYLADRAKPNKAFELVNH